MRHKQANTAISSTGALEVINLDDLHRPRDPLRDCLVDSIQAHGVDLPPAWPISRDDGGDLRVRFGTAGRHPVPRPRRDGSRTRTAPGVG